jgi:N-acetylmuramoyl-L-alanine amidase
MKVPAAVVKVLYLSNPAEEYLAADSWFRLRIVLGLYRAVKAFFS